MSQFATSSSKLAICPSIAGEISLFVVQLKLAVLLPMLGDSTCFAVLLFLGLRNAIHSVLFILDQAKKEKAGAFP